MKSAVKQPNFIKKQSLFNEQKCIANIAIMSPILQQYQQHKTKVYENCDCLQNWWALRVSD